MRTVLLVAACTLCLAFAAHGAEPVAAADAEAQLPATPLQIAPTGPQGDESCIHARALVGKTAYITGGNAATGDADDDDPACCAASAYCAQFLSTQALLKPPTRART